MKAISNQDKHVRAGKSPKQPGGGGSNLSSKGVRVVLHRSFLRQSEQIIGLNFIILTRL